jgi:hypothetical protein
MGTHLESQCLSCGRDTAAGTRLLASRKRGLDRERNVEGYLCYACQEGTATPIADQTIPLSGRYVVIDLQGMQHG